MLADNAVEFGRRIRTIRKQKKMTQQELAELLFLSEESVSNFETGKTMCMPEHVIQMCQIFDVFADEFNHCGHTAGIFGHLFYNFKNGSLLRYRCTFRSITHYHQFIYFVFYLPLLSPRFAIRYSHSFVLFSTKKTKS